MVKRGESNRGIRFQSSTHLGKSMHPWNLGFHGNKLKTIQRILGNVTLNHKTRKSNQIVDSLAKEGPSLESSWVRWCLSKKWNLTAHVTVLILILLGYFWLEDWESLGSSIECLVWFMAGYILLAISPYLHLQALFEEVRPISLLFSFMLFVFIILLLCLFFCWCLAFLCRWLSSSLGSMAYQLRGVSPNGAGAPVDQNCWLSHCNSELSCF